jgi:biopolymer transport protein ExbD
MPDDEMIAEINLTPLVDVSLVLVIIFMIVAPLFSNILKPLMLPVAEKTTMSESNSINVSVFSDGVLAVGPNVVQQAQLLDAVKKEIALGRPPWILIRAGADVSHGRVMEILEVVKQSGAKRIGFATRHEREAAQ